MSIATICGFLHKYGFTCTKIQVVALQQSEVLRHKYMTDIVLYESPMMVFVDETGADRRDSLKKKLATAYMESVPGLRRL